MITPFILLLVGLVLIYIEFYLPGAVLGTAGGLLVVSSLFFFAIEYNSPLWFILYLIFTIVCVAGVIKYALWRIPRIRSGKGIYSWGDQTGYQASTFDVKAIGKKGKVISDLKPGGYIEIDGEQHQAISESGYISAGEEVQVIRGEGESLIVRKV